jgi:hypothetical protein
VDELTKKRRKIEIKNETAQLRTEEWDAAGLVFLFASVAGGDCSSLLTCEGIQLLALRS